MRPFTEALITLLTARTARVTHLFAFTIPQIPATWYYTNWPKPVTYGGHTYNPAPLLLSEKEGDLGKPEPGEFTIKNAWQEPLLSFVGRRYSTTLEVIVTEVFFDDDDVPHGYIAAEGQLQKLARRAATQVATFKPLAAFTRKKIPALLYSRLDARMPYSPAFGITAADFKQAYCAVTSISQNKILTANAAKLPTGADLDPDNNSSHVEYYKGGFIAYSRAITGIDGRTETVAFRVPIITNIIDPLVPANSAFLLAYPPPLLAEDETFDAYAGYDGAPATAENRFDNFDPNFADADSTGFLGFPHMPVHNPSLTPVECT
jgi:hypothetical protein